MNASSLMHYQTRDHLSHSFQCPQHIPSSAIDKTELRNQCY